MPPFCDSPSCKKILPQIPKGCKHVDCGASIKWQCSRCGGRRCELRDHQRLCPTFRIAKTNFERTQQSSTESGHVHPAPFRNPSDNLEMNRGDLETLSACELDSVIPSVSCFVQSYNVHENGYLNGFVDRLGKENWAAITLITNVNEYRHNRPLNIFFSSSWSLLQDVATILPTLVDECTGDNNELVVMSFNWTADNAVMCEYVAAGERSAALLEDRNEAYAKKGYRKKGLMVSNIDSSVFPFATRHDSTHRSMKNLAKDVSLFIARCRNAAANEDPLERLCQNEDVLLNFDELVNHGVLPNIGGFGSSGVQVYVKRRLTFTPLHDEIGNSEAVNIMAADTSNGLAIWIGVSLDELCAKYGFQTLLRFMKTTAPSSNPKKWAVVKMIQKWIKDGIQLFAVLQTPGYAVQSGTRQCAHLVLTFGENIYQVAWNNSLSPKGIMASLAFWRYVLEFEGRFGLVKQDGNGGSLTRVVLPLYRFQETHNVGLGDEVDRLRRDVAHLQSKSKRFSYERNNAKETTYCQICQHMLDLFKVAWLPTRQMICVSCLFALETSSG